MKKWLVGVFFMFCFAVLLTGAKFHNDIRLISQHIISIFYKQPSNKNIEQILFLPYRSHSALDLPSKLHPQDHREYLTTLKHKFSKQLSLPKMIRIKGGTFIMGCQNKPCYPSELPAHQVTVDTFEIAETEITFEQWDLCVAMSGCYTLPGDLGFGRGDRPVMQVSWDDVTSQYIRWLNQVTHGSYRLPSEAEWEYAARAGSQTMRYWGNQKPSCDPQSPYATSWGGQPWWDEVLPCPIPASTVEVASFKPNPWGLYDMLGSVHEWTQDCENNRNYIGAPIDGSAWQGLVCSRRVSRGGAWTSNEFSITLASRKVYSKSSALERVGFRLARSKPN